MGDQNCRGIFFLSHSAYDESQVRLQNQKYKRIKSILFLFLFIPRFFPFFMLARSLANKKKLFKKYKVLEIKKERRKINSSQNLAFVHSLARSSPLLNSVSAIFDDFFLSPPRLAYTLTCNFVVVVFIVCCLAGWLQRIT